MTAITSEPPNRRDVLFLATGAIAAVGAASLVWPFVAQLNPDASTVAAGFPLEVDLAPIAEGQVVKVFWRGQPIFISHRTPKEIQSAQTADWKSMRDPQPDSARVKPGKEQWLVVSAICTHLGCVPTEHQGNYDGWFCQCHGSQYDSSGRIRLGPAPANLPLVPYKFATDTQIIIGET
ncbi:ubiquinol-cytochrome c reductase iron-sulfur subunit [Rhodopseudomonas sp.]|uniref:ubiquinol-cytochrome c reductase iron-sulfur subunit n=1 Tax=Rhodopseudomonas sp. TaxID=1078 RepID=UPI003B3A1FC4